ncbi:MAG: hypothetical protein HON90_00055 [Halobacteriovoraceae bacterium]|jgi:hypothetical protein|nr:hypothetical protein [Halobacteriovoraceae bacterium]
MDEVKEEKIERKGKKRGRKVKGEVCVYELNKDKSKFFVDLSKDEKDLKSVQEILVRVNNKKYGTEITFKDIAVYSIAKLIQKDVEKIQESSLTEMEKVERALEEHNLKNKQSLSLGEFLLKKLNIN